MSQTNLKKPRMMRKKEAYVFDYDEAVEFSDQQNSIFWLPDEIDVEKDVQDIKVNMTEAESHGVITTLKLFTLYELHAGTEYWGKRVVEAFPRPCIIKMANSFSFFELNVHAPFYNKLNEALGINTDEFYLSYKKDPTLKARMKKVEKIISGTKDSYKSLLMSLAGFSFIEGVVLYSAFAFLKHFQSEGKNKIINVVSGINFSVRDENLHALGGAWLFRTLLKELEEEGHKIDKKKLHKQILEMAETLRGHEGLIVDMIFEKGNIRGITPHQLKQFIESRIDLCLENLGYEKVYKPKYNPIGEWFYDAINSVQFHDFFAKVGNEYNRDWDDNKFTW